MSDWTVVPVRGLAAGKTRLAGVLDPGERRALNALLLDRVLDAVANCDGSLARCIVASASEDALEIAQRRGALALPDVRDAGLNAALEAARATARAQGAATVLVLAADLPDASGEALARLREAHPHDGATVIADRRGLGTNGLLLPAGCAVAYQFGEDSYARHVAALREAGLCVRTSADPALAFDIDTPADYREWQSRSAQRVAGATERE